MERQSTSAYLYGISRKHCAMHATQLLINRPGVPHARAQFGGGRVPPLFQTGVHNMPCLPHFFLFRFCIWRDFKNKSGVCHVLCEELFMLNGEPYIAKLMLKQSLVSLFLLVYEF